MKKLKIHCDTNFPTLLKIYDEEFLVIAYSAHGIWVEKDSFNFENFDFSMVLNSHGHKDHMEGRALKTNEISDNGKYEYIEFNQLDPAAFTLYKNFYHLKIPKIKAKDIMVENPFCVVETKSLSDTIKEMNALNIGSVLITNSRQQVIGIFTERDALTKHHKIKSHDHPISEFMTQNVEVLDEDLTLHDIYFKFKHVSFRHFPIVDPDTKAAVGMISMRDIMKFWNIIVESERMMLKSKYEKAMSVIVHDLRSPIYAIKSINDLLVSNLSSADEYVSDEYPPIIEDTCNKMAHLIDELLEISTKKHGEITLKLIPTDITKLTENTVNMFLPGAKAKNIHLYFKKIDDLQKINLDPQRFVEIFQNLISNGIKYSSSGSFVEISMDKTPSNLLIKVKDSGQGISQEEIPNLFNELASISSRPTANEASTGLGLFITKQMVEAHGGEITAESEKGVGTTFMISLPISEDQRKIAA